MTDTNEVRALVQELWAKHQLKDGPRILVLFDKAKALCAEVDRLRKAVAVREIR